MTAEDRGGDGGGAEAPRGPCTWHGSSAWTEQWLWRKGILSCQGFLMSVCQRDDSDDLALQPLESEGVTGPFTETEGQHVSCVSCSALGGLTVIEALGTTRPERRQAVVRISFPEEPGF